MIPENPEDININASQQGLLEIAEYFYRQKMAKREETDNKAAEDDEKRTARGVRDGQD